jgi:hypothetical protein
LINGRFEKLPLEFERTGPHLLHRLENTFVAFLTNECFPNAQRIFSSSTTGPNQCCFGCKTVHRVDAVVCENHEISFWNFHERTVHGYGSHYHSEPRHIGKGMTSSCKKGTNSYKLFQSTINLDNIKYKYAQFMNKACIKTQSTYTISYNVVLECELFCQKDCYTELRKKYPENCLSTFNDTYTYKEALSNILQSTHDFGGFVGIYIFSYV